MQNLWKKGTSNFKKAVTKNRCSQGRSENSLTEERRFSKRHLWNFDSMWYSNFSGFNVSSSSGLWGFGVWFDFGGWGFRKGNFGAAVGFTL